MKEISYKELRNLPFGTKVRYSTTEYLKAFDGIIANGKFIYKNSGIETDLEILEYTEELNSKDPNSHVHKFYVLEEPYEKMWKELKKKVVNDKDYYGSSRSVYSCSDYDERKHRMSTLNDVISIMSSIEEKSHE